MSSISISGASTIVLKGKYTEGGVEREEGPLSVAAYPGMNVTMTNDAEAQGRQTYKPGGTDWAGTGTDVTTSKAPVWILREDRLVGKTVADQYAAGDNAQIHIASPGDVLQVLVKSGESVAKGSGLSAGTDGYWVVDSTNAAVLAEESSGGALASNTLVRARVL